jgi:hypothetical protein
MKALIHMRDVPPPSVQCPRAFATGGDRHELDKRLRCPAHDDAAARVPMTCVRGSNAFPRLK